MRILHDATPKYFADRGIAAQEVTTVRNGELQTTTTRVKLTDVPTVVASIVSGGGAFTRTADDYELAFIRDNSLVMLTDFGLSIEDEVVGYISEDEVLEIIKHVIEHERNEHCINIIDDIIDGLKHVEDTECSEDVWIAVQGALEDLEACKILLNKPNGGSNE